MTEQQVDHRTETDPAPARAVIPTQRHAAPRRQAPRRPEAPARLDLHDRGVLLRSWLHTLHGPTLDPRPTTTGPLPPVRQLLPNAVAWHVAYAILGLVGALALARSGSGSAVAQAVADSGRSGLLVAAVVLWWGGTAMSSLLWWAGIRVARRA